ncbi:dihydrofolate reductase [Vibrio phage 1.101.O._10N.261.45.C6]|nr:dihydrofolate reductase [Vibrio phage 1.101.O._10N.261.45.C6]
MTIKMILCTDLHGGIGKNNSLPWGNAYPEDLQYFKEQTLNSNVIMGRKTFESLPFKYGLPNRSNIVITSQWRELGSAEHMSNGVFHVGESYVTRKMKVLGKSIPFSDNTWIIGGKSVYEKLLPYVDEIHHSFIVDKTYDCDTFINCDLWEGDGNWYLADYKELSDKVKVQIYKRKQK